MVEAKLLERQVTYWNESIGGLFLISLESQNSRVDLLTYLALLYPKVKSTVHAQVRSQQYPSLQRQIKCRAHFTGQNSPSLPHLELFPSHGRGKHSAGKHHQRDNPSLQTGLAACTVYRLPGFAFKQGWFTFYFPNAFVHGYIVISANVYFYAFSMCTSMPYTSCQHRLRFLAVLCIQVNIDYDYENTNFLWFNKLKI